MPFTLKQQKFIDAYLGKANGNASAAARMAGYAVPMQQGAENLKKPEIRAEINRRYAEDCMGADEVLKRLADQAKGPGEYFGTLDNGRTFVDVEKLIADGKGHLIKGVKYTNNGDCIIEFHDAQAALVHIGKHHKLFTDRTEIGGLDGGPIPLAVTDIGNLDPDERRRRLETARELIASGGLSDPS